MVVKNGGQEEQKKVEFHINFVLLILIFFCGKKFSDCVNCVESKAYLFQCEDLMRLNHYTSLSLWLRENL